MALTPEQEAVAGPGMAQLPWTPGAPANDQEFQERKGRFTQMLSDPRIQQSMLLAGLHLMQSQGNGRSLGSNLGSAGLFAISGMSRQAAANREAERAKKQDALEERKTEALLEDKDLDREERAATRRQRAADSEADREQRAAEAAATAEYRQTQLNQQGEEIRLSRERLEQARSEAAAARRLKLLEIARKANTSTTLEGAEATDTAGMISTTADLERILKNPQGINEQINERHAEVATANVVLEMTKVGGFARYREMMSILKPEETEGLSDDDWAASYDEAVQAAAARGITLPPRE